MYCLYFTKSLYFICWLYFQCVQQYVWSELPRAVELSSVIRMRAKPQTKSINVGVTVLNVFLVEKGCSLSNHIIDGEALN